MNREASARGTLRAVQFVAASVERTAQPISHASQPISGQDVRLANPVHGFESQRHRDEFTACLGRRILPLKFAYTGSAAHTHDQLSRSSGYQNVIGPVQAEVRAFLNAVLLSGGQCKQVVEIGPGNGVHSQAFLAHLANQGVVPEAYYALDFSETLLGLARACLTTAQARPTRVDVDLWDVEAKPSPLIEQWRTGSDPVIACFFGNTIGNVEEPALTLSNIASSLRSGDMLVLSTTLLPKQPSTVELLSPYQTELFHAAVLEVFKMSGIRLDDIRLEVVFEDGAVRGIVECLEPLEFNGVRLEKGERVRCFTSLRFATADVLSLLNGSGWVATDGSDSGDHFVVVATRK